MWEGMFFGFSVHRELELMAIAGSDVTPPASAIENMSILATATSQIDKFLNHQRGLIKEGYYADFVVLKSSPIKDIKNTRHIDSVIVNGETVDREYLQKYKMGIY
jgi:imidazolonepropionase-like amidohydrolase